MMIKPDVVRRNVKHILGLYQAAGVPMCELAAVRGHSLNYFSAFIERDRGDIGFVKIQELAADLGVYWFRLVDHTKLPDDSNVRVIIRSHANKIIKNR
jgi:predicted RNA-binding protein with RPS1 domain